MGHFFVDESIQTRGGFIVVAIVHFKEDPAPAIDVAIAAVGLTPGQSELHSSARLAGNQQLQSLRAGIYGVLSDLENVGRIAVVVVPESERPRLGNHVIDGVKKVILANGMSGIRQHLHLDRGIPFESGRREIQSVCDSLGVVVHLEQDSRLVRGIQVADLVAHTAGIMLLDSLGLVTKTTRVGPEAGYAPDTEMELGFEMWASLRWHFFSSAEGVAIETDDDIQRAMHVGTEDHALLIASCCPRELHEAAHSRFGSKYRGCIH